MDKRFQAYYTKSPDITGYMVNELEIHEGDRVLEPSGGDGEFIDTILRTGFQGPIDTYEINDKAYETLLRKYVDNNVSVHLSDTLWDPDLDELAANGGGYDKIIGNPPYGAWIDYDDRTRLREKYDGIYARESYALFLYRCLKLLNPGGRLSFIIPDTYLFLNNHTKIRTFLFNNFCVERILIFPSKLFPGVAFGYSNLSIITLRRPLSEEKASANVISIRKGFQSAAEFAQPEVPLHVSTFDIKQSAVLSNHKTQLLLHDKPDRINVSSMLKLGDIADCVTGIYTGDNKRFLAVSDIRAKGVKGYPLLEPSLIDSDHRSNEPLRNGKEYVPLLKGSSTTRYVRPFDPWLIQWNEEAIANYHENKKARFQNPSFYFEPGIAVPMVKSRKIRATEFAGMVFDQSIVGVFPRDKIHHDFLLAFLNTDLACEMIHLINPTANNSANYLKQIPIKIPDAEGLKFFSDCLSKLRKNPGDESTRGSIESFFNELYSTEPVENIVTSA